MTMVMWSPRSGGARSRHFKSLARAKDFCRHIWQQDFSQCCYLAHFKHSKAVTLQQWYQGALRYVAGNPGHYVKESA